MDLDIFLSMCLGKPASVELLLLLPMLMINDWEGQIS